MIFRAIAVRHLAVAVASAMVHIAHHVSHRQPLYRIQCRHRGVQALGHGQGTAGIATAVHTLGENGVCIRLWRHDNIIGFARAKAEFIHRHRVHILAVSLHHGHFQLGNTHIKKAVAGAIDKPQPHALTALK